MSASACKGSGDVAGSEFNDTQNVSYGVVQGRDIPIPKDSFASSKSAKFSKMEKCLLVTTAIQSLMLVIAVICVAVTYSKCADVDNRLKSLHGITVQENCMTSASVLESYFKKLEEETNTLLHNATRETNAVHVNLSSQIALINISQETLAGSVNVLKDEVEEYQSRFNSTVISISNVTNSLWKEVRREWEFHVINVSLSTEILINNLTSQVIQNIKTVYSFSSCEELMNLSLLFPAGMYRVRSSNCSFTLKYCSTNTALLCSGIGGNWRRIAYLSNNNSPVECPMGFELINDPNVPALCKRNPTGARCSSITYSTHGISYSQVCGTIHGSYFGDPDGFDSHNIMDRSIRSRSADTPISGNYVDGISLTHGSMNEHHIWTLSAKVNFANPTEICSVCANNKPSYVGMDYSCDVVGTQSCKDNCSPRQIWGSGQCIGNNTFYKNLMQPTSDDIEMRVCTDQADHDEDIFLSFVEIFVM